MDQHKRTTSTFAQRFGGVVELEPITTVVDRQSPCCAHRQLVCVGRGEDSIHSAQLWRFAGGQPDTDRLVKDGMVPVV